MDERYSHIRVPYLLVFAQFKLFIDLRVCQTIYVSKLSYIRTHDRVRTGNEIQKRGITSALSIRTN